jgi:hypothetical protein
MIFGDSKANILYISENKFQAFYVSGAKKPKPELKKTIDWTIETFESDLAQIKKFCDSEIRILIDDELCLVVGISVSQKFSGDRENVRKKAEEVIPEDLSKTIWDFKELLLTKNKQTGEEMVSLQIVALPEDFSKNLINAINKASLNVEAIEPLSTALARELEDENTPSWCIYTKENPTLFFVDRGLVHFSRSFSREVTSKDIVQLNAFVEDRFGVKPAKIIVAGVGAENYLASLSLDEIKTEKYSIDPFISLSKKEDVYGTDKFILNLSESIRMLNKENRSEKNESDETLEKLQSEQQKELIASYGELGANELIKTLKDEAKKDRWRLKMTIATFAISLCTIILGVLVMYQRQAQEQTIQSLIRGNNLIIWENIKGIQVSTTTDEFQTASTTTEIPMSELNVTVLNGSGKTGEAKRVAAILAAQNYKIIKTGNADNNNYETTQIKFSQRVGESTRSNIETLLGSSYNIEVAQTLLEESEKVDILIIIGKT